MKEIHLITGFLGSGKTTFLNNLLQDANEPLGILVNDFGKVNIDASLVRQEQSREVVELTNGSIFCSCLKPDFIDALIDLLKQEIKKIYIEGSGLADPANINEILDQIRELSNDPFVYRGSTCIVDGLFFLKQLPKLTSIENQIKASSLVLVNKCDLIEEEAIYEIEETILSINPYTEIYRTKFAVVPDGAVYGRPAPCSAASSTNTSESRPFILRLKIDSTASADELLRLLHTVAFHFYRIKGLILLRGGATQVNCVNDRVIVEIRNDLQPIGQELVCISKEGPAVVSAVIREADRFLKNRYSVSS